MTRRELYQFVATLRSAAGQSAGRNRDMNGKNEFVLNSVRLAMHRRRGRDIEPVDGEAALLQLLDRDEVRTLLDADDALGQVYQALNAPALESAYRATSKERRKFSADEIPAVSQLFTPRWVVEFLLHNTLGKLWIEWHPQTRLRDQLEWHSEESGGDSESARSFEVPQDDGV